MRIDYYDRQGRPITYQQRAELENANPEYYRIAETFTEGCRVSTVWLGLDHRYGDGPPLIFETMVFGGGLDQYAERWSTEAEAVAGHEAMVEKVRLEADVFRSVVADPKVREAALALRDAQEAYREAVGGWADVQTDFGRILAAIEAGQR